MSTAIWLIREGTVINHPVTGFPATGTHGDTLLVYQLPFGSFVPGQPDATVDFAAFDLKSEWRGGWDTIEFVVVGVLCSRCDSAG